MLTVLYIHHTGGVGGAAKSLVELLRGFPPGAIRAIAIVPRGPFSQYLRECDVEVHHVLGVPQFDNSQLGHYSGLRWLVVLREIAFIVPVLFAILRVRRRRHKIDIVHVNEVTLLPNVILGKLLLRRPVVVHSRSVQRSDPSRLRTRFVHSILRRWADQVVAIDATVRRSLPADLSVRVVHNCFAPPPGALQAPPLDLSFRPGSFRLGFIGNFHPIKGLMDLLEAVRICRQRSLNIELVIAGENPRPMCGLKGMLLRRSGMTEDYLRQAMQFIAAHGLTDRVHLLGFLKDVSPFYRSIDLLCFPMRVEATGRPVIEAGFFGVPSVVTLTDSPGDTLVDGVTGVSVPRQNPHAMAEAIERLSRDRIGLRRMGEAARKLSEIDFQPSRCAGEVLSIYREVLGRPARTTG